jgi:serine/threonine protein kinase
LPEILLFYLCNYPVLPEIHSWKVSLRALFFNRLSYLHSKKIVHRDVKTENMLLDKTRTVKIADFGVARVEASNPSDMTGETGTLGYMAPEVCGP